MFKVVHRLICSLGYVADSCVGAAASQAVAPHNKSCYVFDQFIVAHISQHIAHLFPGWQALNIAHGDLLLLFGSHDRRD